jgi:glycosyltransferase involved in cell wall biosynthesis
MKFSLIVATLDRPLELENLLNSLVLQTFKNFEVIIVDQSKSDSSLIVAEKFFESLDIIYLHSEILALSHARNLGISKFSGEIVAFPDDDCQYDQNVLESINYFFEKNKYIQLATCNSRVSEFSNDKYHDSPSEICKISQWNIFKVAISYTIFLKLESNIGLSFDEQFGVGAKYGSAEETDMLIRLLNSGIKGIYLPHITIYHPNNKLQSPEKGFRYALGFGALHRKHIKLLSIKFHFIVYLFSSVMKIILFNDKALNFSILKGKLFGFFYYKSKLT